MLKRKEGKERGEKKRGREKGKVPAVEAVKGGVEGRKPGTLVVCKDACWDTVLRHTFNMTKDKAFLKIGSSKTQPQTTF